MRKCVLFVLPLVALLALGGSLAVPALAAEAEEKSEKHATYTFTSGEVKFSSTADPESITCKKAKGSGELVTPHEGTLTVAFEECKLLGANCRSLGDAAGTILLGGATTNVYDSLTPLLAARHLAVEPEGGVHIECPTLSQLVLLKGNMLLLFSALVSGTAVLETELISTVKEGKPGDKNFWATSNGSELHPLLLMSVNAGAFSESGINWTAKVVYAELRTLTY